MSQLPPGPDAAEIRRGGEDLRVDYSRSAGTLFDRSALREWKATVVGAGALGNEVIRNLGLLGWGEVQVVDPDRVEPSNLTRSVLFRRKDSIGRNKALAIVAAARELFPDTRWQAFPVEIADLGFGWLRGREIIFSCVDSELARVEIACIAGRLGLACCDGGLGGGGSSRGRASLFPGAEAACFSCLLPPQTRRDLLSRWTSPRHPCWAGEDREGEIVPGAPAISALAGGLQVELAVRWLREGWREARSWEIALEPRPRFEEIRIERAEACPFHEEEGAELVECDPQMSVDELLRRAAGEAQEAALLLDWPICTAASCRDCGAEWKPMRRLGALRRACPECGSGRVEWKRVIDRVDRRSAFAGARLESIGVPERHLCSVVVGKRGIE